MPPSEQDLRAHVVQELSAVVEELFDLEADVRRAEVRDGCRYPDLHARLDALWQHYEPMVEAVAAAGWARSLDRRTTH